MPEREVEQIWSWFGLTGDSNTPIAIFYTVEGGGINHYLSTHRFSVVEVGRSKKKTLAMKSEFVDGFFHIGIKYPSNNFALVRGEPNEEQLNNDVFFAENKIDCSVASIKLHLSFRDTDPKLSVFETILLYMKLLEKFF